MVFPLMLHKAETLTDWAEILSLLRVHASNAGKGPLGAVLKYWTAGTDGQ
jgi:hypothetical protein